jgi:4-carboxymuconolactone decarboxylase
MTDDVAKRGLEIRKATLGAEHVERALASADEFSQPLQDLLNSYCWGAVWGREQLPRKTRSMITLAILTALGRPNELRLHLRGALNNGCTEEEIREVLLHAGVYAGVPAAVDAFRQAREVLGET